MKRNILTALATLILATSLQAKYKDDKIAKDDIPRNEKKLWMKIDETQEHLESSLLSGDQRFLDQLELARKKVADIMLTAEDEKKNKDAVKQLPRAWSFWKRVLAQVEIDDVNEYNLNAALGQRAPEPREEQERPQYAPQPRQYASASQVSRYPTVNIYNNNGNGGQQNTAPQQTNNSQPNLQREAVIYDQPTSNRTFFLPAGSAFLRTTCPLCHLRCLVHCRSEEDQVETRFRKNSMAEKMEIGVRRGRC